MICPKCGSIMADNAERCEICQTRLAYPLMKGGYARPYNGKSRTRREKAKRTSRKTSFFPVFPFVTSLSKPLLTFIIVMAIFFFFIIIGRL